MISVFTLHKCMLDGTTMAAGQLAVQVLDNGKIDSVQFRYTPEYLGHPKSRSFMPHDYPLRPDIFNIPTDGKNFPGFIDDCLPDDWGRKIVAMKLKRRFIDQITLMQNIGPSAGLGSLKISYGDEQPNWGLGIKYEKAQALAQVLWDGDFKTISENTEELSLVLQGGSRPGGARPKLLAYDTQKVPWLVKFNRKGDRFNNAALEWACLQVFKLAGVPCAEVELDQFAGDKTCLKVRRFDVTPAGGRYHIITINGLLKDKNTQDDPLYSSYEDIANLIKKYSYQPREDLIQLFCQLLINEALLNTDDHERNFSLLEDDKGWRLCPVYDVVPEEDFYGEHAIAFNGSKFLPKVNAAMDTGRIIGVKKSDCVEAIIRVKNALAKWPQLLQSVGIDDERLLNLTTRHE